MDSKLKILFAAAEVVPFAKTGGLADVAGALPKVLAAQGHDVRIVMPRYGSIDGDKYGLKPVTGPFTIPHGREEISISIEQSDAIAGVPTYFIRNDYLYNRDSLYGQGDDDHRFIAYCRGMLEMLPEIGWTPDIIHCNDWHTGLVPVYLKTIYAENPALRDIATLFTIHNQAYQGSFPAEVMNLAGLPWGLFTWDQLEFWGQLNFMKAALIYADTISTVSETYAKEIQTPEYGERLEGVLTYRKKNLYGIVNGIDYTIWNPRTDTLIPATFTPERLDGKAACKQELQREMGLTVDPKVPLFGLISRLSSQKGLDLLDKVLPALLADQQMQVVILGTGDQYFHDMLTKLAALHPDKLAVALKFDNTLAHRIYAGSDLFLMPSRYEPCGLGQMISLAYGTVPLVRATGGLADTVHEFEPEASTGNGFIFSSYTPKALRMAFSRALNAFNNPAQWGSVVQNAFQCDYSWEASAKKYLEVYHKTVSKVPTA